jgi:hypothetical protein
MTKLILLALFLAAPAFAADNFGRKLVLLSHGPGSPQFAFQYNVGKKKSAFISFSMLGNELISGVKPATISPSYWAVLDQKTGALISPWQDTNFGGAYVDPGSSQAFTLQVNDSAQVAAILKSLRNSVLVIALKADASAPVASVYLDLGELCEKNADKFLEIETMQMGCPR